MAESESVHSVVKRAREDQIAAQKRREERSWLAGYDAGVRQAAATLEEAAKTANPYAAAALLAHVRTILSMTPEEPSELAMIDEELAAWSDGLRESFDSLLTQLEPSDHFPIGVTE